MNYYSAFGGVVKSELLFPELDNAAETDGYDTLVQIGKIPQSLPNSVKGMVFEANQADFIIRIHGVANYWVKPGNQVIVEPLCDDHDSIRLYFLTNVMAALAYRRGYVPLHASAIYHNEGLVLFAGDSGAGKSTTVAHLVNRGYRLFTDDVCILSHQNGQVRALSNGQAVKLWADSYQMLPAHQKAPAPKTIRPGIEKYIGITGQAGFNGQWLTISKVFFIAPGANFGCAHPLNKNEAFTALMNNVYRKRFGNAMGLDGLKFKTMLGLANTAQCASLHRPINFKDMPLFLSRLETQIAG